MELHLISYPTFFENETQIVSKLLIGSNFWFHLRKPGATTAEFEEYLKAIPSALHYKIILHDAYSLSENYGVGGLHFSTNKRKQVANYKHIAYKSTSCHVLNEINDVANDFDACFLSPIFPSISKKEYSVDFDFQKIENFLTTKPNINVIALGGISEQNINTIQQMGFSGAAILGTVWGENPNAEINYTQILNALEVKIERPYCLSIAGFDPSAGAGVTADIKTFEANNCYGLGVTTTLTYQNDIDFEGIRWIAENEIIRQLIPLEKYSVKVVKFGLIESFEVLKNLVIFVKKQYPKAYIIWDPILKASAGFNFHDNTKLDHWLTQNIDLITPNAMEFTQLNIDITKAKNSILLKGGHLTENKGCDTLYFENQILIIKGEVFESKKDKHGTGCVLSSAIAAYIAYGASIETACRMGKNYVEQFIQSNQGRLGYHKKQNVLIDNRM